MESDFVIGVSVILSAIVFCFLWDGKIHKIYFGLIIGFLLFLVFNTQISFLEITPDKDFTAFQIFLLENKELVLSLSIVFIPLFSLIFLINTSISFHVKNNILLSMLFWGFLPLFSLILFSYVEKHSYISFPFITDISRFFYNSTVYDFFSHNTWFAIIGLLFLLFYRSIFLLLVAFITYIYNILKQEFFWKEENKTWEGDN